MKPFSDATFRFLEELASNNNKAFFNENKQRYEDEVRTPVLDFITEMQPIIGSLSSQFIVSPKKVGGSLMRVHRDTRFSKGHPIKPM